MIGFVMIVGGYEVILFVQSWSILEKTFCKDPLKIYLQVSWKLQVTVLGKNNE